MLGFSLILFLAIENSSKQFRILSITCIGVGLCTTLFYICIVKEPSLTKKATLGEENY